MTVIDNLLAARVSSAAEQSSGHGHLASTAKIEAATFLTCANGASCAAPQATPFETASAHGDGGSTANHYPRREYNEAVSHQKVSSPSRDYAGGTVGPAR